MNIQNKNQWDEAFIRACVRGTLEEIRHLCQKQYLDLGWADIHALDDDGFCWACTNGRLEVVKYLLTSQELIEAGHTFADVHARNENGFRWACRHGHLEVVKYLLTSPELKEAGHNFADVHAEKEEGFCWACENEHWGVVRWLVMDYEIEKTPTIEKIIENHPQAQEYLKVRDEFKEIQGVIRSHEEDQVMDSNERPDGRSLKKMKKL